jgi:hypothetical protein
MHPIDLIVPLDDGPSPYREAALTYLQMMTVIGWNPLLSPNLIGVVQISDRRTVRLTNGLPGVVLLWCHLIHGAVYGY